MGYPRPTGPKLVVGHILRASCTYPALRRLGLLIGTAAAAVALAAAQVSPAFAAAGGTGHTVSITENQQGTWTETGDNDFCTGELIDPTITGNSVMHVTYFPAGDEVWGTFTTEGRATFLQPSSELTFSGRVTVWGNFNVNEKNSNSPLPSRRRGLACNR